LLFKNINFFIQIAGAGPDAVTILQLLTSNNILSPSHLHNVASIDDLNFITNHTVQKKIWKKCQNGSKKKRKRNESKNDADTSFSQTASIKKQRTNMGDMEFSKIENEESNVFARASIELSDEFCISVKRSQVLTLWGCVVCLRLGFSFDEALSIAQGLTGKLAKRKARRIGLGGGKEEEEEEGLSNNNQMIIYSKSELKEEKEDGEENKEEELSKLRVSVMGEEVECVVRGGEVRSVVGSNQPTINQSPSTLSYLKRSFGDDFDTLIAVFHTLLFSLSDEFVTKHPLYFMTFYHHISPQVSFSSSFDFLL